MNSAYLEFPSRRSQRSPAKAGFAKLFFDGESGGRGLKYAPPFGRMVGAVRAKARSGRAFGFGVFGAVGSSQWSVGGARGERARHINRGLLRIFFQAVAKVAAEAAIRRIVLRRRGVRAGRLLEVWLSGNPAGAPPLGVRGLPRTNEASWHGNLDTGTRSPARYCLSPRKLPFTPALRIADTGSIERSPAGSRSTAQTVWLVNPFDQLPNETDVRSRYSALATTLSRKGHAVVWWTSDFSHRRKTRRSPEAPGVDAPFSVRFIETSPYAENVGFARLRNHWQFARRFRSEALAALDARDLDPPHKIVVSLPPLGTAAAAFAIRDRVNAGRPERPCEAIVDIQDAWPEAFHQLVPARLRPFIAPAIFSPWHLRASESFRKADKLTAVGRTYLDLASHYLDGRFGGVLPPAGSGRTGQRKPMHVCYLGTEPERFRDASDPHAPPRLARGGPPHAPAERLAPLKAAYLGSMGIGYDLETLLRTAARWSAAGILPFEIHLAGDGPRFEALQQQSEALGLDGSHGRAHRVVFHGYLFKDDADELLRNADLALVPNRPGSWVACPNKAAEYAAAGLPMLTCLRGELADLLTDWDAGSTYAESDVESLDAAFRSYASAPATLARQGENAAKMARAIFDRSKTYPLFSNFILGEHAPPGAA